jgi:hypothetical protein
MKLNPFAKTALSPSLVFGSVCHTENPSRPATGRHQHKPFIAVKHIDKVPFSLVSAHTSDFNKESANELPQTGPLRYGIELPGVTVALLTPGQLMLT